MKTDTLYTPENLQLWTMPHSYYGAEWSDHYVFLSQNRDSDCLTRSNFRCALAAIGGERTAAPDDDTEAELMVSVIREGHWGCGWVEWIAIHKSNADALRKADQIMEALENYPVVDESDFSELEQSEAADVWRDCYDDSERVDYIRRNADQFDFRDFSDLLSCARGRFFGGYASELLSWHPDTIRPDTHLNSNFNLTTTPASVLFSPTGGGITSPAAGFHPDN